MNEPAWDLGELVGVYKEDARKTVAHMRDALARWDEMAENGPASQELRKLAHQLRGSGRTYGFRNVSRVAKALERLVIKLQSKSLEPSDRLLQVMKKNVQRLSEIFNA